MSQPRDPDPADRGLAMRRDGCPCRWQNGVIDIYFRGIMLTNLNVLQDLLELDQFFPYQPPKEHP